MKKFQLISISFLFCLFLITPKTLFAPPIDETPRKALLETFDYLRKRPHLIPYILKYSYKNDISPGLLAALIHRESKGYKWAVGPIVKIKYKGKRIRTRAKGVTQLIPEYHDKYKCYIFEYDCNIKIGSSYLKWCIDQANGFTMVGLKNYNSGPNSDNYYWDYIIEVQQLHLKYLTNYYKLKGVINLS